MDVFNAAVLNNDIFRKRVALDIAVMIKKDEYPEYLKTGKVLTLSKTNKTVCKLDNTRQICVMSHITKAIEKVVFKRLEAVGMMNYHEFQTGFTKGTGTETNVTLLINAMANLKKTKAATILALDISKAYDRVPRTQMFDILYKMCEKSLRPEEAKNLINCIAEIYNGHRLTVEKDGKEFTFQTSIGLA